MQYKISNELFVIAGGAIEIFLPVFLYKLMTKNSREQRGSLYATLLGGVTPSIMIYVLVIMESIISEKDDLLKVTFIITFMVLALEAIGLLLGFMVSPLTKNMKKSKAFISGAFPPSILWALLFWFTYTSGI